MSETNAERLERIKKRQEEVKDHRLDRVNPGDVDWLIEQAELANKPNGVAIYHNERIRLDMQNDNLRELVQESAERKEFFRKSLVEIKAVEVVLRKENKRLRETLAFYADNKNYEVNVIDQWAPEIKVMMDGGAKAAELLEGMK